MLEPRDIEEIDRLAKNIHALMDEAEDAHEIRELDVRRFRCQLDDDTEGAERVLKRIKGLALFHETSGKLIDLFGAALVLRNPALARAAEQGVRALVKAKLAETDETGEEAGGRLSVGERRPKREQLRLSTRAVQLWESGATVADVARCLKVPRDRAVRILKPIPRKETPYD